MAKSRKLPAMQWYPGDWRKDVGVQSLSYHDRGVWFEILNLMHESECRGVLLLNGAAMSDDALARLLGLDNQILTTTLTNLLTSGVASRDGETGALMNRRMVRDENLRNIRSKAGKTGGNPVLLNQKSTTPVKQIPTPSSSSSSSSSISDSKPSASTSSTAVGPQESAEPRPDPRHAPIRELIMRRHFERFNVPVQWDGSEGKALDRVLASNPSWSVDQMSAMVNNYFDSEGITGARPRKWLPDLGTYAAGPLDRYGRAVEGYHPNVLNQAKASQTAESGSGDVVELPESSPEIALWVLQHPGERPWELILGRLQSKINRHSYETWLKPTRFYGFGDTMIFVSVPTKEFTHIGSKYQGLIEDAIKELGLPFSGVKFVVGRTVQESDRPPNAALPNLRFGAGLQVAEVARAGGQRSIAPERLEAPRI